MSNSLPLNWCECKLEAVCSLDNGQKQEGLELPLLDAKFLRGKKEPEYRSEGVVLYPKDFVILVDGENSGEIFSIFQKGIMGSTFKKLNISSFCSVPYILYFIKSNQGLFRTNKKGAAIPHLDKTLFKNLILSLPPLAEQERLVEKIEALFADIDEGVERLKSAQAQIKQYRQSVLKSAFEGKLYKTTEWEKTTLGKETTILGDGLHGTPEYNENGEYFFINGNNLSEGSIIIKSDTKRVDKKEYDKYKKELGKTTVLVSINGTLGNLAFYNNEKIVLGKSACYFNVKENLNKKFIYYKLKTNTFLKYANLSATGSTIKNVSLKSMRDFPISLPSLLEQQRIVEEIEKRFTVVDELEKAVNEGLEKADKLKQSILKKAFEGKLVAQNPNDEPASVLLDRIKKSQTPTKGKKNDWIV